MKKQRVGIFKLTSCSGCQLSILNMEDELLSIIDLFNIAYFREATDNELKGEFDISFVEGSISTDWQKKEIIDIRWRSRALVTIGACATSGGLQALRNWSSLEGYKKYVYQSPEAINALSTSTPVSDHVYVDYELWGCPISTHALSETLVSFILDRKPVIRKYSVCMDCKKKGIPCLLVSKGEPCLGPITLTGCGAICPSIDRPCYGCFGPKENGNIESLLRIFKNMGITQQECIMLLDKMNTYAYRKVRIEQSS